MNLNITYDQHTLNAAPSGFFGAVNYVVSLFDATFTNNVTVNVEIGYGTSPYDNSTVPPLGESQQNGLAFGNYSQVRQALVNEGVPGSSTLPATSPLTGRLVLGSAEEKALGIIGASSALDGWVGIASEATLSQRLGASWSYSATATPGANQYYLVGVLEHEITEIMGRLSYLNVQGEYGVMDLYRYKFAGVRQTSTGGPAYFSIDGGTNNLDNWNTLSGGDIGDWVAGAGPDAFLAFSQPGQINGLSTVDLTNMAALGWTTTRSGDGRDLFVNAMGGNQLVIGASSGNETVWTGAGDTIIGGGANATIGGVPGVTIIGGYGGNQFIDASQGHQSVIGGSGGNETIWGAASDTIRGGSGGNETIGGVPGETIIGGSGANVFINAMNGNQSIVGGSAGNLTVWTGAGDTIRGGSGDNETIGGVAGVTILGGSGGNEFFDGHLGGQSITGGGGNTTVWGGTGDTIQGASGTGSATIAFGVAHTAEILWDDGATSSGSDTVYNFSQSAGDRISLSSNDSISSVVASAAQSAGNTIIHLHDGSSITLIGVTAVDNTFFTTH